jgi:short-subunit dehydrogenase
MDVTLKNPVVLITGATHGLGRALAIFYAQKGHSLLLTGRDKSALEVIVGETKNLGVSVFSIIQDLSCPEAVANFSAFIDMEALQVDVLINNAGIGSHAQFATIDADEMNVLLQVNINALVTLTRLIVPKMLANQKGKIINIASVYSFTSVPNQVLYAASKAFVKSFSSGLAMEVSSNNISVLCVCPGTITQTLFRSRIGLKAKENFFSAPASLIARKIYKAAQKQQLCIIPMWYNRVFVFVMQLIPARWQQRMVIFFAYRLRRIKQN